MKIKVLFVCLGNICRSPMAEGSFKALVKKRSLDHMIHCDSAGTAAYHIGKSPDSRMCKTALSYGIKLEHQARQLSVSDFEEFDYILAMDRSNLQNIQKIAPLSCKAKVYMFREFDLESGGEEVPDPYYGGAEGFEEVFEIAERCSSNFLNYLEKEHNLK